MNLVQPQWHEIRNQLQKGSRPPTHTHKYTDSKQHATKQQMDQRRNKTGNKKLPETNEHESTTFQNVWDAAKAYLR